MTTTTPATAAARAKAPTALRRENAELRERLAKLAALVDHYYGAYRETHSLLERRERELADLRRRFDSSPISLARQRGQDHNSS